MSARRTIGGGTATLMLVVLLVVVYSARTPPGAQGGQSPPTAPRAHQQLNPPKPSNWSPVPGPEGHPAELLQLAKDVRAFRSISVKADGVDDFAATAAKQQSEMPAIRQKLNAPNIDSWSTHSKVDYLLLRSELDDTEFDLKVLRPTTRNPSFYVNSAIRNLYRHLTGNRYMRGAIMPYSKERAQAILQALADTDKFLAQGRRNLTEIVPELADVALEHPGVGMPYTEGGQLEFMDKNYGIWAELTAKHFPQPEAGQLPAAAAKAARELMAFGDWLKQNRSKMTGKVAFGIPALDWYTRNVMLIPYTSEQLKLLADVERARALTSFQFESHKNRNLPMIEPAKTTAQYLTWEDETSTIIRRWYVDEQQILSDRDYMMDVRGEEGYFLPPFGLMAFPTTEKPGVKRILVVPADHWRAKQSNMGFRTDPGVLHGHEYRPGHYYEGEVHRRSPCPIRPGHNDNATSQGWCNYLEEMPVQLNFPYVRGPRARELVFINLLQRTERINLGIKVISGELAPKAAMAEFRKNVPPLGPGVGATYEDVYEEIEGVMQGALDHGMTGMLQLYKLLADRKMQMKEKFDYREFNDTVISMGSVPLALMRWEMTGFDDEVKGLLKAQPLTVTSH